MTNGELAVLIATHIQLIAGLLVLIGFPVYFAYSHRRKVPVRAVPVIEDFHPPQPPPLLAALREIDRLFDEAEARADRAMSEWEMQR